MMKQHLGFTLVELLYTLAVAALIMGVGIPAFTNTMRNTSMTAGKPSPRPSRTVAILRDSASARTSVTSPSPSPEKLPGRHTVPFSRVTSSGSSMTRSASECPASIAAR